MNFQAAVREWMMMCFGPEIADDKRERNHRFLEESLELVQSTGMTASEAHQLVDYTFNRPIGERDQETGGVMVTLAALCEAQRVDMMQLAWTELNRCHQNIPKIRAKQAAKPKHSALPQVDERAKAIQILEEIAGAMDALNYKPSASHMRQAIEILKGAPVSVMAYAGLQLPQSCPNCNNHGVRSAIVTDKFMYGVGDAGVELSAEVTMFSCSNCGESWTGEQGEKARQAAVDKHVLEKRGVIA
jgi:hypothetical protein